MEKYGLKFSPDFYNDIYLEYLFGNFRPIQIIYGGAGSSKSYSIAQNKVDKCLNGANVLGVRKVGRTVRDSMFNEIWDKIEEFQLTPLFKKSSSTMKITCLLNGRQIVFAGADNVEKLKSIRPEKGIFHDIWLEEATEFSRSDFNQFKKRLRGIDSFYKQPKTLTMSFNPILKSHWIYKDFFENFWKDGGDQFQANDDISILKTTHLDNRFMTPQDRRSLTEEKDKYSYDVYTLGNWGIIGKLVYPNWRVENFDIQKDIIDQGLQFSHGIDWGFWPDPFAYVKSATDFKNKIIYICKEIYGNDLLNEESIPLVKPHIGYARCFADTNEPKSIKEFRNAGIDIQKAYKGVNEGIKYIQGFTQVIHENCPKYRSEIEQYHYMQDKITNEYLPQIVKKNDHLMDAKRYAETDYIKLYRQRASDKDKMKTTKSL